jgi:CxxC motif-containing protein
MNIHKNFTCVSCPVGCSLVVAIDGDELSRVDGNACQLGEKYARNEVKNPLRMFTSTVRVTGGALPVCPVRSDGPLPKRLIADAAREVAGITITAPVEIGQVIIRDIFGTGLNIVAGRSLSATPEKPKP